MHRSGPSDYVKWRHSNVCLVLSHGFTSDFIEDESRVRAAEQSLLNWIDQEVARGIPWRRIILAGFSKGGAIALHTALRCVHTLGSILALLMYLPLHRHLAVEANLDNKSSPIFMAHGDQDDIVAPALEEYSVTPK